MSNLLHRRSWSHRSTVIVLVLAAGLLVWGNLGWRYVRTRDLPGLGWLYTGQREFMDEAMSYSVMVRGLPLAFRIENQHVARPDSNVAFFPRPLVLDAIFGLASLTILALLLEPRGRRPAVRARFQYGLGSAIVAVLTAGVLLGTNLRPCHEHITTLGPEEYEDYTPSAARALAVELGYPADYPFPFYRWRFYGWPLPFWQTHDCVEEKDGQWLPSTYFDRESIQRHSFSRLHWYDGWQHLVYDVLVAALLIFGAGLACERCLRWRAQARKDPATP